MEAILRSLFISFFILSSGILYGQSADDELEKSRLQETISSGDYRIEVDRAYPRRAGAVFLTSIYSLEVKNDSVYSHLPFYGRAYTVPYGGGNGLVFNASIINYKTSFNRKGRAKIEFEARTDEDTYKFFIEIYPNGTATINVNMRNRDSMRYSGNLI